MSGFVDFETLKQTVSIEDLLTRLNIPFKKAPNGQLRACCPIHGGKNEREFVATPSKGLWHCFGGCQGGDIIQLIAKLDKIGVKEAAAKIQQLMAVTVTAITVPVPGNRTSSPRKIGYDPEEYASRLNPAHDALEPLGISEATLRAWKAGYAPSGLNAGRLALPVYGRGGAPLAHIGRSLKDESPILKFPNGFKPEEHIFGIERVAGGEVRLVRDPLDVLRASEVEEMAIAFLTELIEPVQHEMLASHQDEKKFKVFY